MNWLWPRKLLFQENSTSVSKMRRVNVARVTQTFPCLGLDRTGSGSLTACACPQLHPIAYTDLSESGSRTRVWNFKNISLYIFLPLSSCSLGEKGKRGGGEGLAIVSQTVDSSCFWRENIRRSVTSQSRNYLGNQKKKKKKENVFLKIYIWMQVLFFRTKLQCGTALLCMQ